MNIIEVIEKYIELSIRRDKLNDTIENAKRHQFYAKIEGDLTYDQGDYELEKLYNKAVKYQQETQEVAAKNLTQVEQLLVFTHQTYIKEIQSLDEIQIQDATKIMTIKKSDIERKLQELSKRQKWATSQGDVAFDNNNFKEEKEYNRISSECYFEIEKIKPMLHYYELFVTDLNYRANKKDEQDFNKKRPIR